MLALQKLAFVLNASKPQAEKLCEELRKAAEEAGTQCTVFAQWPLAVDCLDGFDACCVVGGDGTILGVVPAAVQAGVPVFGVNCGKLGFLATLSETEVREQLTTILRGGFRTDTREILECRTADGRQAYALNDIVLKRASGASLINLEVRANDDLVTHYACDGLILLTPTGSTAYNLSAGGPLIHPNAGVIGMTPICPHTLTNRSVVFAGDTCIEVRLRDLSSTHAVAILDGRDTFSGAETFPVRISTSGEKLKLLHPEHYSHFHILRQKLRWGG